MNEEQIEKIGKAHGMPQHVIDSVKNDVKADRLIEAEEKRVADEKARKPELPGVSDGGGEVSANRLKSFIQRVERMEEKKKAMAEDIRDIYAEAKSAGFEPKIMRKIVTLRKANIEKRREEAELMELYMSAIGMAE